MVLNFWTEFEKYVENKKYLLPGFLVLSQVILLLMLKLYCFSNDGVLLPVEAAAAAPTPAAAPAGGQ